jgi:Flp pilus assembly protein TadD
MVNQWLNDSPRLASAYAEHGWLLRKEGNLPLARQRLEQALDFDPTDRRALTELAAVYETMGRADRAVLLYERDLTFHPGDKDVEARLASLRDKNVGRPRPD